MVLKRFGVGFVLSNKATSFNEFLTSSEAGSQVLGTKVPALHKPPPCSKGLEMRDINNYQDFVSNPLEALRLNVLFLIFMLEVACRQTLAFHLYLFSLQKCDAFAKHCMAMHSSISTYP